MALKQVTETHPLAQARHILFLRGVPSYTRQRVGGRSDWRRNRRVSYGGAVTSADLGGSSNYSNASFED